MAGKKQENDEREVTVEIKSVNHRYLDLNIKVPRIYSFLEEAVKSAVFQPGIPGEGGCFRLRVHQGWGKT